MDDKYQLNKKPYLPPRLVSVAFKVELGSVTSRLTVFDFSDNSGLTTYSTSANDGESFWNDNMTSPISSESYTGGNWSW